MLLKLKKTLALFLAVVIAFGSLTTALANDEPSYNPYATSELNVASDDVDQGETVSIPVTFTNNPGFNRFTFTVVYDKDVLTPELPSTTLPGSFDAVIDEGSISVTYTSDDTTSDIMENRTLFTMTFKTGAESAAGDAGLALTGDMQNLAGEYLSYNTVNGLITVNPLSYTVTVLSDSNGTASANQNTYHYGDTVKLTATPNSNCSFVKWSSSDNITFADASASDTTFTMPAKNVTVNAAFLDNSQESLQVNVSCTPADGGTVSANNSTYAVDGLVHLDADPATGYYFSKWESTDIIFSDATNPSVEFNMPANDVAISAVFEKLPSKQYMLNINTSTGGTVDCNSVFNYSGSGSEIELTALPDTGYAFKEWKYDSSALYVSDKTNPVLDFIMPNNDVELTAVFEYNPNKKYKVTVQSAGGGTAGSTYTEYAAGERVVINATQQLGYVFYCWDTTDDGITFANAENASTSFTMPARDVTIVANFAINTGIFGGGTTTGGTSTGGTGTTSDVCMIYFDSQGGSTVTSISAFIGGTLTAPTAPTRAGYSFGGWYTDAACTNAYNFASTVNQSFTLYARWIPVESSNDRFSDVKSSDWFYDPVYYLVDRGIINGITATTFAPNQPVTRAQFAQMLALASGATLSGNTCNFADVSSTDWFYPAVAWASANGIVNGVSATSFAPNARISRQDMAVMIARYIDNVSGATYAETAGFAFADDAQIASYAKESVSRMQKYSIIGGKGNNRFAPLENATRAEAAKMIFSMLDLAK